MVPRLKNVVWQRTRGELRVVYDIREHLVIADPDGLIELLLELLAEGGRSLPELAEALAGQGAAVPEPDLAAAVAMLDAYRLLEDERRVGRIDADGQQRYFSNLAFFESFATLGRSREDLQQAVRDAHVLVLGTGGLNCNTIPHLCGLGVGRLTLLDRDAVEPRNFARQYLYRHADLGARKVELAASWVNGFDPDINVEALDLGVDSEEQVGGLVDRFAPDLVMSGIDSPVQVDTWVNDACVRRGVPYVRGGMYVTQGLVWSVDPGVSGCRSCLPGQDQVDDPDTWAADQLEAMALYREKPRTNRGIGPVAGLLGALCAFEVLRYLTRFEPPAYAGRPLFIDFASGCSTRYADLWPRHPSCPVCTNPPTEATEEGVTHRDIGDSPDREHPADEADLRRVPVRLLSLGASGPALPHRGQRGGPL
jgi:molybdopterin/thiamine biosynthesis adenylyltransferase